MSQPEAYSGQAQRLWDATGVDWHISMSLTLTEPVCAFVTIYSDDGDMPHVDGFIGNADANDSIRLACEHILKNLETFFAEFPDKRYVRADR